MNRLATAALAAAMSLTLSAIPAIGADTDTSVKEKASNAWEKTKEKTSEAWDKTKAKTSEAWDKTKAKTNEAKDKEDMSGKTATKGRVLKDKVAAKIEASPEEIRQAQQALKDKGHDPGPIDGVMGPRTSTALRDFQKKENLKVNGRLDDETRSHLMAASGSTAPAASPKTTTK